MPSVFATCFLQHGQAGRRNEDGLIPLANDNRWIENPTPHPAFGHPLPIGWGEGQGEGHSDNLTVSHCELVLSVRQGIVIVRRPRFPCGQHLASRDGSAQAGEHEGRGRSV